jgi:hypothetical protein
MGTPADRMGAGRGVFTNIDDARGLSPAIGSAGAEVRSRRRDADVNAVPNQAAKAG